MAGFGSLIQREGRRPVKLLLIDTCVLSSDTSKRLWKVFSGVENTSASMRRSDAHIANTYKLLFRRGMWLTKPFYEVLSYYGGRFITPHSPKDELKLVWENE